MSPSISHPFNQEYNWNCPSTPAVYEVYQLSSTAISISVPSCPLHCSSSSLSLPTTPSVPYICWVQKVECSVPALQVKAAPARQPLTLSCWTGCTCTPVLFMSYTDLLTSHTLEMHPTQDFHWQQSIVRFLNGLVAYALHPKPLCSTSQS